MRHEKIKVNRDNNTVHNTATAPWEIPVIEYVFGEHNVERLGEFVEVSDARGYPDPGEEMARLTKVYGVDTDSGVAFAVTVYGTARIGVRAMARAIEEAEEADVEAAKPRTRRKSKTVSRDYANDPLMA